MSNPLERQLAAEAYLGITAEEIARLQRIKEAAEKALKHLHEWERHGVGVKDAILVLEALMSERATDG